METKVETSTFLTSNDINHNIIHVVLPDNPNRALCGQDVKDDKWTIYAETTCPICFEMENALNKGELRL